jgi:cytochrome o ubiquinol oxidase subunit 2
MIPHGGLPGPKRAVRGAKLGDWPAWGRRAIFALLIAGLTGCAAANKSFLHPYGQIAADQRDLFFQTIGWMMIVVVPVFVLVPLFAWRYRRKNGSAQYRPDWAFSWPLELAIWGLPVGIVAVLAYLVNSGTTRLDPYAALPSNVPPLEVQVVGLDWKWLFVYPEERIATVGMIALPTDRPVHFELTSDTVMQSFFIPPLGSQIYAMAGMVTQLNLKADRPGRVIGENTQFNGVGFQDQKFVAEAMTARDFSTWVADVRANGIPLDDRARDVLFRKSTAQTVYDQLGTARMPASVLYISNVGGDLFDDIVAKYRSAGPAGPRAREGLQARRDRP